jgi:hypothetical protein
VTASMAWPHFHREMETEVDNQVAAPAATRTPNLHRANKLLTESADGRVATAWRERAWVAVSADKNNPVHGDPPSFLAEW